METLKLKWKKNKTELSHKYVSKKEYSLPIVKKINPLVGKRMQVRA
jgi:hypothetical protein